MVARKSLSQEVGLLACQCGGCQSARRTFGAACMNCRQGSLVSGILGSRHDCFDPILTGKFEFASNAIT